MILVVSDRTQDGHVAPVVSELTRRGHEVEVFDPAVFPGRSEVTLESTHRGVRAALRWEEHDLDLDRPVHDRDGFPGLCGSGSH